MTTPLLGTELVLSLANGDEPSALVAVAFLLRLRRDDLVALGAHDMSAWSDVSSAAERGRGLTVLGAFCESCDVGVRMAFDSTGQPVPVSPGRDVLPWPGRCAKAPAETGADDTARAQGASCDECRGTEGVEEVVIAGERMDLCRVCLPKFQAMDYFGGGRSNAGGPRAR